MMLEIGSKGMYELEIGSNEMHNIEDRFKGNA